MFRIKICYWKRDNGIRARITTKNCNKLVGVRGAYYMLDCDYTLTDEFSYQLIKICREICRDELLRKYGTCWRKYENKKQILASSVSAIKRMKQVSIFRERY